MQKPKIRSQKKFNFNRLLIKTQRYEYAYGFLVAGGAVVAVAADGCRAL